MRGDPEYDDAVDLLYRKEKKKAQQKLRAVRVIVILLGIVSILVLFTLDYRPFRVAALPFVLGLSILRVCDPHWRSLNRFFTYYYVGVCGAYLLDTADSNCGILSKYGS